MKAKGFKIGEEEDDQALAGNNALAFLIKPTDEGQKEQSKPKPKKPKRSSQKTITKNQEAKPEDTKKSVVAVVDTPENVEDTPPVNEAKVVVDRRKVADKKKVVTTILRGSLIVEIDEIVKKYRQQIDVDYNLAKFYQDGSLKQIAALKKKITE